MKRITREWIDKAEGDWSSAQREARARKNPNYDSACFHAQQCVEKYLKARLQEANIPFSKNARTGEIAEPGFGCRACLENDATGFIRADQLCRGLAISGAFRDQSESARSGEKMQEHS
jgi:hypothetical protein